MQESWDDTDLGQTVTINCQEKHVRDGSPERTCETNGGWTEDPPLCRKSKFGRFGTNSAMGNPINYN